MILAGDHIPSTDLTCMTSGIYAQWWGPIGALISLDHKTQRSLHVGKILISAMTDRESINQSINYVVYVFVKMFVVSGTISRLRMRIDENNVIRYMFSTCMAIENILMNHDRSELSWYTCIWMESRLDFLEAASCYSNNAMVKTWLKYCSYAPQ